MQTLPEIHLPESKSPSTRTSDPCTLELCASWSCWISLSAALSHTRKDLLCNLGVVLLLKAPPSLEDLHRAVQILQQSSELEPEADARDEG